jgi:type I restriction enzyme S subunit
MGSENVQFTVDELVRAGILEKPLDGNHGGIHPKSSDFVETGIPFIMASDLIGGRVDLTGCKFITEKQARKLRKGFAKKGDVLISHKATIGRTAIVGEIEYDYLMLTPQVTYYRVRDNSRLNNRYLKYYFDSRGFQDIFNLWAGGGSTRAYLGITAQLKLPVKVPDLKVQEKIVDILAPIDDKIELNSQMNETLEQMAQALFKSWFVDFDPVIDNAQDAGNPIPEELVARSEQRRRLRDAASKGKSSGPSLPDDIRFLFPSEFELTDEMGWIPKGWKVSTTHDEFEIKGGSTPSTKNPDFWEGGDINWTSPKDLSGKADKVLLDTERKITRQGLGKITSGLLPVDTVLMSSRAPVGYLALAKVPVAINQGYIALICNKKITPEYSIQWLSSVMDEIKSISGGTTFSEISKKTFRSIKLVVPVEGVVTEYTKYVAEYYQRIAQAVKESDSLSALRDYLLPKLISGELQIPDAEQQIAEVMS